MRLNVQHLNIRSFTTVHAWIERQLRPLRLSRQIDEANVRLVRLPDSSPAYQVQVHLVTPGPDVFAETRDHTLRAAFTKALHQLRDQIASRTRKRLQRLKRHLPARTGR